MTPSTAEGYLRLGLQVGRHVDGIVDAYFRPPEPTAEVEAAPPVEGSEARKPAARISSGS